MSLDLYFKSKECETCGNIQQFGEGFNYTYNCSPMWQVIFPGEKFVHIDGLSGKEALAILDKALVEFDIKPERFKKLNPENGFGDFDSFKGFIRELRDACLLNPDFYWSSWR